MRKALPVGILAALLLTSTALAGVYEGTTVAASSCPVETATGGILREINVLPGDIVHIGDTLGTLSTTKVFATQDGTVTEIPVSEGESADGTVLEVFPLEQYQIYCTVEEAYSSVESTLVHSGENVYIKCTADGTHRGVGLLTKIEGMEYRVLAVGGEFYVGETVYLYRDRSFSPEERIGIGTVVSNDVQTYTANGTIVRVYVSEDEYVERGELLFEYSDSSEPAVIAETGGIITEVFAEQGDTLKSGDVLLNIVPQDQIRIEIQVDEIHAARIRKGDTAELIYTMDSTETPYSGKVERIARIPENGMYTVRIQPDETESLRLGLTVTVRIPEHTADES